MIGFKKPRQAENNSSSFVVFLKSLSFFPEIRIMKRAMVEVKVAIVSIVRTSSSPNPILKTVGIVDQKKTALPA